MNSVELSHNSHKNNIVNITELEERISYIKSKDCIEYRLVQETYKHLEPFLKTKSTWLTIGDLYGAEANYLKCNGQCATASDLSDTILKEVASRGAIDNYREINVESIDFADNTFDYVFCKEAFHHFPRAFLGFYEMIRVSAKAAIMIEPIDVITKMPLLLLLKNFTDRIDPLLINKIWKNRFSWETVGNYVFKISEREVEKIAMGIGARCIAFKGINILIDGKLSAQEMKQSPTDEKKWAKFKRRLAMKNILSKLHIVPANHLICMVFKHTPENQLISDLKNEGYKVIPLPPNPYL